MEENPNTTFRMIPFDEFLAMPLTPRRKLKGILHDTTPVKNTGDALGRIWWQGRQWAVTSDGVEARDGCYHIAANRVLENIDVHAWVSHMAEKDWVDLEDFATAWLVAVALHNSHHRAALKKACGAR